MKTMRMPKGWVLVGTNAMDFGDTETREEKIRREQAFKNLIRNTAVRSEEKMKKDADAAYEAATKRDEQLLQAYNDKRLKSKAAIKAARKLKKKASKASDAAEVAATV